MSNLRRALYGAGLTRGIISGDSYFEINDGNRSYKIALFREGDDERILIIPDDGDGEPIAVRHWKERNKDKMAVVAGESVRIEPHYRGLREVIENDKTSSEKS